MIPKYLFCHACRAGCLGKSLEKLSLDDLVFRATSIRWWCCLTTQIPSLHCIGESTNSSAQALKYVGPFVTVLYCSILVLQGCLTYLDFWNCPIFWHQLSQMALSAHSISVPNTLCTSLYNSISHICSSYKCINTYLHLYVVAFLDLLQMNFFILWKSLNHTGLLLMREISGYQVYVGELM